MTEPICREPWESFYILRRGILPCCYGNPIAAEMKDFARAWNSRRMRTIRRALAKGRLSRYCLESRGCPVVQRYLSREAAAGRHPGQYPAILVLINRLSFGLPGRTLRWWRLPRNLRRG